MTFRNYQFAPLALGLAGWLACSSPSGDANGGAGSGASAGTSGGPGSAGTSGQAGVTGPTGGGAGSVGSPGNAGANGSPGVAGTNGGSAGSGTAGVAGTAGTSGTAGVAGTAGVGGGAGVTGAAGGGLEPGDTPPWRALNVTAPPKLYVHGNAGVDTRAKSLGKLGINLGVSGGGYSSWLGRHGYHVMGSSFGECNAPNLDAGRDAVGTCRLGEWAMVSGQVKTNLTSLATQYPEEDWGYFLNKDGSVRWSDVAFTGVSHGATTAAIIGRLGARVWRVVSCAGPRDNTCGKGTGTAPYDPANPPFDPACPDSKVASWLDKPSLTPMDRFYGLTGTTDGQYGDIMFNMERTKYPGAPIQWNLPGTVLTGGHRFYSSQGGHLDFLNAADNVKPPRTEEVLNIAFAIPLENQNPTF